MLKNIERVTKQRIAIEKVPTVADLRARRLELTRAALHESLLEDDLEQFRVVVETLADEFDVMEVALAAVKLAHEARPAAADEDEMPTSRRPAPERATAERGRPGRRRRAVRGKGRGPVGAGGIARVFVGAGRSAGIRPQDLVGAIAGETRLTGRDIGGDRDRRPRSRWSRCPRTPRPR